MYAMLAINWEPELRGILIVIIGASVLMGSIYIILMTNMGARLGFLVVLTALAGWFFILGAVWWTYGKGLLGTDASWQPVGGRTVLQDTRSLSEANVLASPLQIPAGSNPADTAGIIDKQIVTDGWKQLDPAAPSYQQAGAAATTFLEDSGALKAGEFQVVQVFDKGGQRRPQLWGGKIDFLAFFHKPHYSLVEAAPLVPQRDEAGRAPAAAVIDTTAPHQYVYMIRDMGSRRKPAGLITVGSLMVFLVLCYLLHSRDRRVLANRAAIPVKV
jgi:hypothetical protein